MTEAQAVELIEAAFNAGWPTAAPGVAYSLNNEAAATGDAFALLTTLVTSSAQRTHGRIGNRKVKRDGWIQVKLWSPAGIGMRRTPSEISAGVPMRGAELADAVRALLEMIALPSPIAGDDPVTTMAAMAGPVGEDGRWFLQLIRVPFWFTELK